jgi:hypothetical protein
MGRGLEKEVIRQVTGTKCVKALLSLRRTCEAFSSMLTYPSNQQASEPRSGLRAFLQKLGPYQSLTLLLVTLGIAEPMKLVAVAVAGDGHWITGTAIIIAAYATSLLLVERLFRVVKPKLLTLPWFVWFWTRFVWLRSKFVSLFNRSWRPWSHQSR